MSRIDPSFSSITWNITQTGEQPSKVDLTNFAISESGNVQPIKEDLFIKEITDYREEISLASTSFVAGIKFGLTFALNTYKKFKEKNENQKVC